MNDCGLVCDYNLQGGEHEVEACALMGSEGLRVYKDYDEQGKALWHDLSNAKRMLQRTPKTMAPIIAAGDPLKDPEDSEAEDDKLADHAATVL